MKVIAVFSAIFFLSIGQFSEAVTPVSLNGSNPYFSTQLYPQDLLLRQGNYLYYYPHYQSAPWWGNIDEPTNIPTRGDYTVTGIDIVESGNIVPNQASFKHIGSMQTIDNNIGYAWLGRNDLMANLEFDYSIDALRNSASGTMIGNSDSAYTIAGNGTLPFNYSNRHTLNRFSVKGMVGSMYRDFPIGIKFSGGFENTLSLKKELSFTKLKQIDSITYDPNSDSTYHYFDDEARALWGWNTSPCSHIFGVKGPQGDSWLQDQYSIGPLYHFDLLGGITLPKVKAGIYYRFKRGHQDQFQWHRDTSVHIVDQTIAKNFIGQYDKNSYSLVRSAWEARVFGNINHRSTARYSLNTFASVGYIDSTIGSALSENLDIEQYSKPKDAIRSIALEVDPNISIRFGEFLNYLDAALLFEYRYSRYSNTSEQPVGQGMERGFQSGTIYGIDDEMFENFSYANENSLHTGADFSMLFPVFSSFPHHLGLGFMLVGNLKYTFQTKYYGSESAGGGTLDFTLDNMRKNYKREIWFNSFLMLHYMNGPYQIRLEATEPFLYTILRSKRITDAGGNDILKDEKLPLWVSQRGMGLGIYASYDIILPFLHGVQK